jgi:hypothetical protein
MKPRPPKLLGLPNKPGAYPEQRGAIDKTDLYSKLQHKMNLI